jgi:tetratricopeptide (TPR) repeat protein
LLPLLLVLAIFPPPGRTVAFSDSHRRTGASGMLEPHTGSLLVDYYESYLHDQDIDAFRRQASARYMEGTLARLIESPNPQARRAAVLALGLFGSFKVNASVARGLRDADPTVRSLAEHALWAIWFRADSAENNTVLERVSLLISQRRFEQACRLADQLVSTAPTFAEAYNQRAIANFHLGRFKESADDCNKALERNPFHIGALSGLAQCLVNLDSRDAALAALKRAAQLQPYNANLKQAISALEMGMP